MTLSWPSLRLWRRIAIGAFVAIIAILIAARLFALSPMARNMVESRLETMTVRGQSFELDGLKGDLLGRLSVDRLSVRDADGIWLDATDIALDWAPLSYLSQHLNIKDVSAAKLSVTRRPTLLPGTSRGGAIPRVTLEALSIPDMSLAAGVAGPAQTYTLSGQLRRQDQTGRIEINLSPQSHDGDKISAALDWGGDIPLRGRVDLSGAPSGLIATLIEAPDGQAIAARLIAEGTLTNWQLVAQGTVGDAPAIDLDLSRTAGAYAVQGQLALDTLGRLDPLQARLGTDASFTGTIDAERNLSATLAADTLTASATGQITWLPNGMRVARLNSTLSQINIETLAGVPGLSVPALDLDGALTLTRQEQVFDGKTTLPRLAYQEYVGADVATDGSFRLTEAGLDIEADISLSQLSGLPNGLAPYLAGPATAQLTATLNRTDRAIQILAAAYESRALQATAQGTAQPDGDLALAGTLSTTALPYISELEGAWSLTGPSLDQARLKFTGDLDAAQGSDLVYDLVGNDAQLDLSVLRIADQIRLESASLNTPDLQATASGQLLDGRLSARSQIKATSLAVQSATLDTVLADLVMTGPVTSPDLDVTAEIAALTYAGQSLSDLKFASTLGLSESSDFALTGAAQYLEEWIELDLAGRRDTGTIRIDRLAATWDTLTANGAGNLDLQTPSASDLNVDVSGSFAGLEAIEAHITYQDEDLTGIVTVQETAFGPLALEQAAANLSGRWPRFTGEVSYDARLETPGGTQPIAGRHGLHANLETRALELDGAATLANQTIAFVSPLIVNLESGLRASGQVMAFGGQINIDLKPLQTEQSTVQLSNVSVRSLGRLLNRPGLIGQLDAETTIGLQNDQLTGETNGSITGLSRGLSNAPATDLVLEGAIENSMLLATLATKASEQNPGFVAQATVPLQHAGTLLSVRPVPSAAIPVSITGEGPIEPLWALAAPTDLRVEGRARVDIRNGTGETWRFEGPVQFEDGVFEDGITGIHLTDISVDAALRPDGIDIQSARAGGRRGGFIDASGAYKFDGSGSVIMSLNRLNALNRSDVSATVSGTAEIDRQNRRTSISGDFEIDQARVNLEKLPRAGYTTLDVVFTDQVDENGHTAPAREAIVLNLDVSADRRIFVTGSGVDTEWGLAARVTGSPGRPNIIGRANLIRGEADLLNRRFRFSDGQIRFVGDPQESQLLIRADRDSDEVTSTIILSGSLTDPEITLSSDPSLPNDEILSRVLFGRSPSELSPLQAAQLAGAAAQLAGGDALNLVGQLQEATGLDRLDIGLDDAGAATLSTGKYLSKDIYLEIESGGTGAPGVALEWTPLENVAVDAEIDPELGPKVAIQWKRDFDRLPGEPDPE